MAIIEPLEIYQIVEASVELEKPDSFVNLAHDPEIEFEASTAFFPSRPFVSFVCFVVHSARQYLRSVPYDRSSRHPTHGSSQAPSTVTC